MTTAMQQLQQIEVRCARQVCGGGYLTRAEADRLEQLRQQTGMTFDAVNQKFYVSDPS